MIKDQGITWVVLVLALVLHLMVGLFPPLNSMKKLWADRGFDPLTSCSIVQYSINWASETKLHSKSQIKLETSDKFFCQQLLVFGAEVLKIKISGFSFPSGASRTRSASRGRRSKTPSTTSVVHLHDGRDPTLKPEVVSYCLRPSAKDQEVAVNPSAQLLI